MNAAPSEPESTYAWLRLSASLLLMTVGGVGMYVMSIALPAVQAEFGTARGGASLPYTATMIGFGIGGILMGRLADRFGVIVPVIVGGICLGGGFVLAGMSQSLGQFTLAHGMLIGFLGCSATFAPLVADTALWFTRRRGIAVAICASGNYLAGTVWPPIVQYFFATSGWRSTYVGVGLFCTAAILLLSFALRRRPPAIGLVASGAAGAQRVARPLGLSANALTVLLAIAGVACCVAMSMPQVHIVAYCGDLGYGPARGAEMLSLMLGFGIVSRLLSGWISDHIGGLRTLLLGSVLQGIALLLFLPSTSLVSLYVVSALFGLFQGGIVPAYALIVREYFDIREAGIRTGIVLMATLFGMALGGWMSGAIFDLTGSYRAAFLNGIAWNLLNLTIAIWMLHRKSIATRIAAASRLRRTTG
ncbi:MAG TPA: MFS transporter [Burkholderiales bacterium]|jgi:MFS family permease|nr:MFS transporter [Burkholderiales bacterium]